MTDSTTTEQQLELLIDRENPKRAVVASSRSPELDSDQVLLRLEKFGFTANNMTYVTLGKALRYFDFFPAADPKRYAKLPVWGVATVVASNDARIDEGERVYGCFPLARYVALTASTVTPSYFAEARPHLPPDYALYGQYSRARADPLYTAEHEDAMLLFRPLWLTSFLLDDFLAENGYFGAQTVVISSASSKTSFGLADLLTRNRGRRVVGLTSERNAEFVRRLGMYTDVISYDRIDGLNAEDGAVLVDVAGNAKIVKALHDRLGDRFKARIQVGLSHGQLPAPGQAPASPVVSHPFFAPGWGQKRAAELGAEHGQRIGAGWAQTLRSVDSWVTLRRASGPDAVLRAYEDLYAGESSPQDGLVLSL